MRGIVYVLSNPAYRKDLLKIGFTTRTIEERINELSSTGVPSRFQLEFCIEVSDAPRLEKILHVKLSNYKYEKEFFKLPMSKLIETIKNNNLRR